MIGTSIAAYSNDTIVFEPEIYGKIFNKYLFFYVLFIYLYRKWRVQEDSLKWKVFSSWRVGKK